MKSKGYPVHQLMFGATSQTELDKGTFVVPTAIELPNLDDLQREVFGPVLHIITYKYGELEQLISRINAKGYGLTMGLHTRIDETIQTVIQHAEVGNLYINRNIVGAVVGVQPFGGEGLSGTGPKAGGPLYMYRLMQHCSNKVLATPFAVKMSKTFLKALTVRFIKAYTTGRNNIYHKQTVKLNLLVLVNFMSYKALLGKVTNILFCRVIVFFQLLIQNKINCISYLQSLQLAAKLL